MCYFFLKGCSEEPHPSRSEAAEKMKTDDDDDVLMKTLLRLRDCSWGDAVAARNGLWVTLRCRPCCAAAVEPRQRHLAAIGSPELTCWSLYCSST